MILFVSRDRGGSSSPGRLAAAALAPRRIQCRHCSVLCLPSGPGVERLIKSLGLRVCPANRAANQIARACTFIASGSAAQISWATAPRGPEQPRDLQVGAVSGSTSISLGQGDPSGVAGSTAAPAPPTRSRHSHHERIDRASPR